MKFTADCAVVFSEKFKLFSLAERIECALSTVICQFAFGENAFLGFENAFLGFENAFRENAFKCIDFFCPGSIKGLAY